MDLQQICTTVLTYLPDAAIALDHQGRILQSNPLAAKLFGYGPDELAACRLEELVSEELRQDCRQVLNQFLEAAPPARNALGQPWFGRCRNGATFPLDMTLSRIGAHDDGIVLATFRNNSCQNLLEAELRHANRALRLLSASNRTLLHAREERALLQEVCRVAVEIGGYSLAWVGFAEHDEEKNVRPAGWFGYEDGFLAGARMSWGEGERGRSAMSTAIRTGQVQLRLDILHDQRLMPWHEDALHRNYQSAIALPLHDQEQVIGAIAIYAPEPDAFNEGEVALLTELADDLSFGLRALRAGQARDDARARAHRLTYFDRLTGLPNRSHFLEQLEETLAAARTTGQSVSLMLLSLQFLREINEAQGHATGDEALARIAWRLQQLCGPDRFLARFGGDDFTILCLASDEFACVALAEQLLATLTRPLIIDGRQYVLGGHLGIAVYLADELSSQELLSRAEHAVSRAREASVGYCFYREEMGQDLARRLEIARRLEWAIRKESLQLYFQPKIDLASGRLTGAEVLLRWHDARLGAVGPAEFIPVAEQRGLMVELGAWVLRASARQIRDWTDRGLLGERHIAVNVSYRQLDDPNFLELLAEVVAETGVPPERMELELTESSLMRDPEQVLQTLAALKQLGFSLAIDDFGTGYSSLVYLKRFPVDTLKIDQAFVRDMLQDANDRAIVSTIVAMARQLGLTPVAEGVTQEEQRQALLQLGCSEAQGYHFGQPVPAEEFVTRWLRA